LGIHINEKNCLELYCLVLIGLINKRDGLWGCIWMFFWAILHFTHPLVKVSNQNTTQEGRTMVNLQWQRQCECWSSTSKPLVISQATWNICYCNNNDNTKCSTICSCHYKYNTNLSWGNLGFGSWVCLKYVTRLKSPQWACVEKGKCRRKLKIPLKLTIIWVSS